jgi:hypothetical protein
MNILKARGDVLPLKTVASSNGKANHTDGVSSRDGN